jgi:hypothetical protein
MNRQVARYQRDDQEFGRAIGFFDATYALALTLLVTTLEITEPSSEWDGVRALWDAIGPQFLAFGISFAVIASYWLAYHRLVRTLAAVDQLTIIANLVLIASIVIIPFSTNAVGDPALRTSRSRRRFWRSTSPSPQGYTRSCGCSRTGASYSSSDRVPARFTERSLSVCRRPQSSSPPCRSHTSPRVSLRSCAGC